MRKFIVAEISKNWERAEYIGDLGDAQPSGLLISQQFEQVIDANRRRGYKLHSFQLHRMMTSGNVLNETIVAVFELTNEEGTDAIARERLASHGINY